MLPIAAYVAAALLAAGTYQKNQQMKKIAGRQREVTAAEMARQRGLDDERAAAMAATQPAFDRSAQEAEQQSIAQKLAQAYTPPAAPQAGGAGDYIAASGQPQEITDRMEAARADAARKGQDYASKLANLSSYRLLNFGNSLKLNRLGEDVGRINSAALRSSEILPIELQDATRAGDAAGLRADLFNGAGSIAAMYAMTAPTTVAQAPAGGTGLTVPEGFGSRTFAQGPGLKPGGGLGLKAPGVPRLVY